MASKPGRPAAQQPEGFVRRDRPWLLPSNGRLRNLVSISLRNLSLAPPSPRRQPGITIDDDGLPNTLVSPAKLVALREQRTLEHSRSSSDLRGDLSAVEEDAVADDNEASAAHANGSPKGKGRGKGKGMGKARANGVPRMPQRPPLSEMRRRSTLEWANATPQRRQEKLESVTAERVADVFFSMHVDEVEEPVYVSETVERTMNPTFRHVDWSVCGPGVTRLDRLTLRFWTKSAKMQGWGQLLEMSLSLRSLQYLGKNLEQLHHVLPQNAVIFHLTDGVYTAFPSLSDYVPPPTAPPARATSTRILPTSSFDALLRLAKLDDSIQDALATRNKIATDLEDLLEANKDALIDRDKVPEAEDRLQTIDYAKKTVHKQLDKARKQQDEKRSALRSRRQLMQTDISRRSNQAEDVRTTRPELQHICSEHHVRRKAIASQRRRICEDLQTIYPITATPGKPLAFTIRSLPLPNSEDLDTEPGDHVAAALGHVAHVVQLLAFYLESPLPYPVTPRSSTSTVLDPISLLKTSSSVTMRYEDERALRSYPLFGKGVARFRYEYGVFVLNKDTQILLEMVYRLRVLDVRQTLPNLKYLLYVATAGEGEVPARKAGGVRGLLRGVHRAEGTPMMSRAGSEDSTGSALSGLLWHGNEGKGVGGGRGRDAVESLRRTMGDLDGRAKKG